MEKAKLDLEKVLTEKNSLERALKKHQFDSEEKIQAQERQLSKLNEEISYLNNILKEKKIDAPEAIQTEMRETVQMLEGKFKEVKEQYHKKCKAYEDLDFESSNLKTSIQTLKHELQQATDSSMADKKERHKLEMALLETKNKLNEVSIESKRLYDNLKTASTSLDSTNESNAQLTSSLSQEKRKCLSLEREIDQLKFMKETKEKEASESLEALKRQVEILNRENTSIVEKYDRLVQQTSTKSYHENRELTDLKERVRELETRDADSVLTIEDLQKKIQFYKQNIEQLNQNNQKNGMFGREAFKKLQKYYQARLYNLLEHFKQVKDCYMSEIRSVKDLLRGYHTMTIKFIEFYYENAKPIFLKRASDFSKMSRQVKLLERQLQTLTLTTSATACDNNTKNYQNPNPSHQIPQSHLPPHLPPPETPSRTTPLRRPPSPAPLHPNHSNHLNHLQPVSTPSAGISNFSAQRPEYEQKTDSLLNIPSLRGSLGRAGTDTGEFANFEVPQSSRAQRNSKEGSHKQVELLSLFPENIQSAGPASCAELRDRDGGNKIGGIPESHGLRFSDSQGYRFNHISHGSGNMGNYVGVNSGNQNHFTLGNDKISERNNLSSSFQNLVAPPPPVPNNAQISSTSPSTPVRSSRKGPSLLNQYQPSGISSLSFEQFNQQFEAKSKFRDPLEQVPSSRVNIEMGVSPLNLKASQLSKPAPHFQDCLPERVERTLSKQLSSKYTENISVNRFDSRATNLGVENSQVQATLSSQHLSKSANTPLKTEVSSNRIDFHKIEQESEEIARRIQALKAGQRTAQ